MPSLSLLNDLVGSISDLSCLNQFVLTELGVLAQSLERWSLKQVSLYNIHLLLLISDVSE